MGFFNHNPPKTTTPIMDKESPSDEGFLPTRSQLLPKFSTNKTLGSHRDAPLSITLPVRLILAFSREEGHERVQPILFPFTSESCQFQICIKRKPCQVNVRSFLFSFLRALKVRSSNNKRMTQFL